MKTGEDEFVQDLIKIFPKAEIIELQRTGMAHGLKFEAHKLNFLKK